MVRKKTHDKLAKYINIPKAMALFCHHYGILDDVYLEYKFWEDALPGEPGDLILPLVAIIEGGVRGHGTTLTNGARMEMGHQFRPPDEWRKPQERLTNFATLQIVYNSEVCTDNYENPHSAFLLLHYVPSVKTFLACRQVKDKKAAKAVVENQAAPHHDIRHMSGINIRRLLPPRTPAGASGSAPPGDLRQRKRKASTQGEASWPEPPIDLEDSGTDAPQSEVVFWQSKPMQRPIFLAADILIPPRLGSC
uniref:Uncharacterized protein n=1 Tax=Fagus sylvatica TaxID=28930 RepID=A0A2N9F374_FAGSY